MKTAPLFLTLFFSLFMANVSAAQTCSEVLSTSNRPSNLSLLRSFETYKQLKSSPMWNHESPQLNNNALATFTQTTRENSAETLFSIYTDLTDSAPTESLEKLLTLLEKTDFLDSAEDVSLFKTTADLLEKKYNYIIDFPATNPTRLSRYRPPGTVVLKSVEDIQRRIGWIQREKDTQWALFHMMAETADDTVKSQRFVYEPNLDIKPTPERVVLLVFMIRGQHYELFEALVHSPPIHHKLHLDYSVMLLDEIDELPSSIRHSFSSLAQETLSPEALAEYNVGKRGVNRTMWDRIPLNAY